jgi:hypothetical protein
MNRYACALVLLFAACEPYKREVVEPSPAPVDERQPPPGAAPGQGVAVEDMTASARKKAAEGDCEASRALADKVRAADPEYYRAFVVPDPVITKFWTAGEPAASSLQ